MRSTNTSTGAPATKLSVTTKELQELLSCGRDTAVKIGTESQAKLKIGKRALWNVSKVQAYLDAIAE